ncbi:MAG: 50S ribosomal protein L25/general stress protein Ctc [Geminicoccaceae bacterium]|nr:50S ribosomal protein L25/general stress protein Ctc [Geminicoccaceae bacterium]
MAEHVKLAAFARERTGTGGARAVRREGRVPAIVYGGGEAPLKLALVAREVRRELTMNPHFFNAICEIELDGKVLEALPREAQLHPVSDEALHLDFIRVGKDTVVTVEVPVHFLGEEKSKGLRRGGVLNVVRHEIEVSCPADSIPAYFEIDLSGYDIGDSIHISAVKLPEGVKPTITDRDFTIVTIAAPTLAPTDEGEETTATPAAGTAEE